MKPEELEAIRQRDAKGYSETCRQWNTNRVLDSEAQAKIDRHELLAEIDRLRITADKWERLHDMHCDKSNCSGLEDFDLAENR